MMTSVPAIAMSAAVPRSGWIATSPTGTRISTLSTPSEIQPGGSGRSCRYQAHIIGTASFISSEGWKRNSPRFSQRCAPMPTWPIATTLTSSRHPNAYSHGVVRRRKFGFTRASSSMAKVPRSRRSAVRTTVAVLWPEALYSTMSPKAAMSASPTTSGPSVFSSGSTRAAPVSVRRAREPEVTSS